MSETTAATTSVPAEAHGTGFPPFESSTFPGQLLWLALTFGALYLFLSKVALPRLAGVIEERHARIAGDVETAAAMKKRADDAATAYESALAEARRNAQAIAQQARDVLTAQSNAERKTVEDEMAAKLAEAERTIAATKAQAMSNVESIATGAAAAIIERLLGRSVSETSLSSAVKSALQA